MRTDTRFSLTSFTVEDWILQCFGCGGASVVAAFLFWHELQGSLVPTLLDCVTTAVVPMWWYFSLPSLFFSLLWICPPLCVCVRLKCSDYIVVTIQMLEVPIFVLLMSIYSVFAWGMAMGGVFFPVTVSLHGLDCGCLLEVYLFLLWLFCFFSFCLVDFCPLNSL